jgi:hypothetical protein
MAQEMEFRKELDADVVGVLHVCPEANKGFRDKVTSPELARNEDYFDDGPFDIWKKLVSPGKFQSISVESLFNALANPVYQVVLVGMGAEFIEYLYLAFQRIWFTEDRHSRPFLLDFSPEGIFSLPADDQNGIKRVLDIVFKVVQGKGGDADFALE